MKGGSAWLAMCLLAGAVQAAQGPTVQDIEVLKTIPGGQWELTSRVDHAEKATPPQLGCLSAEGLARGLQELVTTLQSEQRCTIQLTSNTDALGVLELRCPQDGRELVPAVMEFRRPAPDRLEVRSQLQFGPRSMHLAQDYQWKGACPQ